MYEENPKEFNKTTKQAIVTIIQMDVFCGDKTDFARPGHICCSASPVNINITRGFKKFKFRKGSRDCNKK